MVNATTLIYFGILYSGGLLIVLPRESAEAYCKDLNDEIGCPAWIVGEVVRSENNVNCVSLIDEPNIVDVPYSSIATPKCQT